MTFINSIIVVLAAISICSIFIRFLADKIRKRRKSRSDISGSDDDPGGEMADATIADSRWIGGSGSRGVLSDSFGGGSKGVSGGESGGDVGDFDAGDGDGK